LQNIAQLIDFTNEYCVNTTKKTERKRKSENIWRWRNNYGVKYL